MTNSGDRPVTTEREDDILRNLSYDTIAEKVTDESPTVARAKILRGWQIAARRMTPQQVIDKLHDNYVVVLRRSWWSELPRFLLMITAALAAIFLAVLNGITHMYALIALAFMPLTVFAAILHRRYNRKYTISSDTVTIVMGLIDLRLTRVGIPIARFKAIEVRKTLVQRILGVGDVQISTVMFDQPEVVLAGLNNPHFYLAVLRLMHDRFDLPEKEKAAAPT